MSEAVRFLGAGLVALVAVASLRIVIDLLIEGHEEIRRRRWQRQSRR